MKIFIDFETTGISVYNSEIITGYFLREDGLDYFFKSKVNKWSYEAQEVHKITEQEASTFPEKKQAIIDLIKWLPNEFEFVCYSNPNTQDGFINFDFALLHEAVQTELDLSSFNMPYKATVKSVYTMIKDSYKNGLFNPIRGKSGRFSFKQTDVYTALFDTSYDAHDARSDVLAMKRIYETIIKKEKESFNKNGQGVLIWGC